MKTSTSNNCFTFEGSKGSLSINASDQVARKIAMLFEGQCMGLGATKAAEKYGYTRQRYYQVLTDFINGGSNALTPKKQGPKSQYVRTQDIVSQVIRHRFLDPSASAAVITQKLRQTNFKVSQRSVERIITDNGLQKKTLPVSTKTPVATD